MVTLQDNSPAPPSPPAESDAKVPHQTIKTPTGLGAEPLNIVILGASFGGLSCAHFFLDYTIMQLRTMSAAPNYRLVIVSPSTHIYWNIGAPRLLVAPGLINHEDAFIPIEPGFHRHRGHNFTIIQGEATALDTSARTVTLELIGQTAQKRAIQINKRNSKAITPTTPGSMNPKVQTINYHALLMATGTSAHSDLLSLHGPHLHTVGALTEFHARVANAKSVIICGGGTSGVETAGQIATFLNHSRHWPFRKKVKEPKTIILITGSNRCLSTLKPAVGIKAEKMLKKLGVDVRHNIRVVAARENFDLTGATSVELNDDTSLIADVFVACTGVAPNSSYAPREMRDERGYVRNNALTMRCDGAGDRVYAVGDVASYSYNYVLDVYAAVPVVMHNMLNDLISHELRLASPYGGNQDEIDALEDAHYEQRVADSFLCPISRFGGVGVLSNVMIPRAMVHLLKGHDYRTCKAKNVVVDGGNPYAIKLGNKFE